MCVCVDDKTIATSKVVDIRSNLFAEQLGPKSFSCCCCCSALLFSSLMFKRDRNHFKYHFSNASKFNFLLCE